MNRYSHITVVIVDIRLPLFKNIISPWLVLTVLSHCRQCCLPLRFLYPSVAIDWHELPSLVVIEADRRGEDDLGVVVSVG